MTEKGSRQAGTRRGACPGARRSNTTTVSIIRNMKREEYTGTRPTERGIKGGNDE